MSAQESSKDRAWLAAAAAVVAHLPALGAKFSLDDLALTRDGLELKTLPGLWHLLTSQQLLPDSEPGALGVFRPASAFFYWLSWQLVRGDAMLQHAIEIALHATVALVLVRTLARRNVSRSIALAIGCAFAVHPATAEAASSLAGRPMLLGAIPFLWSLGELGDDGSAWRARSAAAFAALCHEVFLAGAVAIAIGSLVRSRRSLASTAGSFGWLALAALAVLPMSRPEPPPLGAWIETAGRIAARMLRVVVAPTDLSPFVTLSTIGAAAAMASFVAACTLAFVAVAYARRISSDANSLAIAGGALIVIVPLASAPAALRAGSSADRLAYACLIGAALLAAPFVEPAWNAVAHARWSTGAGSRALRLLAMAAPVALVPLTWSRASAWYDGPTLCRAMLAERPQDAEGRLALAMETAFLDETRGSALCQAWSARRPRLTRAHLCVAVALEASGRLEEAIDYFRDYSAERPHMGHARRKLFVALLAAGRVDEARAYLAEWTRRYRTAPDLVEGRRDLAKLGAR